MKRRRVIPIKKIKEVIPVTKKETPKKRVRKNPPKQLIKSEFYTCTQTLRDGTGKICFIEGGDYLLHREVNAKHRENNAIILRSETWGRHLVYLRSWGQHFVKSDRVEKLTEDERKWFDPGVYDWQESVLDFLQKTGNDTPEIIGLQSRVVNHMKYNNDHAAIQEWHELVGQLTNKTSRTRRKRADLSNDKPKRVRKVRTRKEKAKNESLPSREKEAVKVNIASRKKKRRRRG